MKIIKIITKINITLKAAKSRRDTAENNKKTVYHLKNGKAKKI